MPPEIGYHRRDTCKEKQFLAITVVDAHALIVRLTTQSIPHFQQVWFAFPPSLKAHVAGDLGALKGSVSSHIHISFDYTAPHVAAPSN